MAESIIEIVAKDPFRQVLVTNYQELYRCIFQLSLLIKPYNNPNVPILSKWMPLLKQRVFDSYQAGIPIISKHL